MLVLLPPDPPPGLPADAGAALGLGLLLDAVDELAGTAADLRVALEDPCAAALIAALLPPGIAVVPRPPAGEEVEVVRIGAAPPADLAASLDREGAPSRSPRAWHLAHRLSELAHWARECQPGGDRVAL
jgi:hypothetical protein